MARKITVAAAQVGAVHIDTPRKEVVDRMLSLLAQAASQGAQLVVFPETTLTTFFPRFLINDQKELDSFFEHGTDLTESPGLKPLIDAAREHKVDVSVGFAERTPEGKGYNTCIYYSGSEGKILSKFRKIHLPGTSEPFENPDALNQLEKRYFEPGDLGFKAFRVPGLLPDTLKKETAGGPPSRELEGKGDPIMGMMICNDRRWPEAWRTLALQGVEVVMVGYNTPFHTPDLNSSLGPQDEEWAEKESVYHHQLVMKANSYMNACFSICAARAGWDDGKYSLIGASCIIDSEGHIRAEAKTKDDEVVVAEIDLEEARQGKLKVRGFQDTIHFVRC
jgi:predicted amidohydrolase